MSKWNHIKIKEDLPSKVNKHYLIWCESVLCQFVAYIDCQTKQWKCAYSHDDIVEAVTAWRYLPKNPQE